MRLSDIFIRQVRPLARQKTYFDDALPGFGLRVGGRSKSFIVMYGKKRRLKTLGQYPDLSLSDARKEARKILAFPPRPQPTISFPAARDAFLAHCAQHNRPSTVKGYAHYLHKLDHNGKLVEITRAKLHTLASHPHTLTTFKIFFNWCIRNDWLDKNPLIGERPRYNPPRTRILSEDELRCVLGRALVHTYPFGAIVALCIMTGMRRSEVATLEHDFIKDGTITLPPTHTKNKREHVFPYGTFAASILASLPHIDSSPYLFPGRGNGPWNGWSTAKILFDRTHTVSNYTLHDLRRTFASVHAQLGTPIHVIEKLLNHASGSFAGVAGIYNRYQYLDEMKHACQRYEDYLHSLCS